MDRTADAPTAIPAKRHHRRSHYLINGAFQWKYTISITTTVFLIAATMGMVLFGILRDQARSRVLFPSQFDAWENTLTLGLFALVFSVVVLLALGVWGILVTHRISGPAFVLERHLGDLANGRFPKRRDLRKRDEFKSLHTAFWHAADAIRAEKETLLTDVSRLRELALTAPRKDARRLEEDLDMIAAQLTAMRDDLAKTLGHPISADSEEQPVSADSRMLEPLVTATSHA